MKKIDRWFKARKQLLVSLKTKKKYKNKALY